MKTLDKLANQKVTAQDVEQMQRSNGREASTHPWAYTQRDEKALSFSPEVAYDPRLIKAGVVHGD